MGMKSMKKSRIAELHRISYALRLKALEMIWHAKAGHASPAYSMCDILTVLYFEKMRLDPQAPDWEERDRFVLSKGHACATYYAALARRGFFPEDRLLAYRQLDSMLAGHPDAKSVPGVEVSTGSLGNGVSCALGMAMVAKRTEKSHRVYAIAGDGELQEGIVWEAAMAAGNYGLDNFTLIVDCNGLQSGGDVRDIMDIAPLADKFKSFKWCIHVIDGHNIEEICDAIDLAGKQEGKPHVILAKTVKGKGVSYMENRYEWHMKAPTDEEYAQAVGELERGMHLYDQE